MPKPSASDDGWKGTPFLIRPPAEVPILGSVRAGYGGAVFEEIVGYEPVQASSLQRDEAYFWLSVTGDSMEPVLCEGDLVLVRKQTSVDNGSMAVMLVGGEEGLVKKIFYGPDWIELHSLNPAYAVRRFEGPDVLAGGGHRPCGGKQEKICLTAHMRSPSGSGQSRPCECDAHQPLACV